MKFVCFLVTLHLFVSYSSARFLIDLSLLVYVNCDSSNISYAINVYKTNKTYTNSTSYSVLQK